MYVSHVPSSLLHLINHDSSYLRVITKIKHFVVPLKRMGITIMNTLVRMYSTTRGRLVNVRIVGRRCVCRVLCRVVNEMNTFISYVRVCSCLSLLFIISQSLQPGLVKGRWTKVSCWFMCMPFFVGVQACLQSTSIHHTNASIHQQTIRKKMIASSST